MKAIAITGFVLLFIIWFLFTVTVKGNSAYHYTVKHVFVEEDLVMDSNYVVKGFSCSDKGCYVLFGK